MKIVHQLPGRVRLELCELYHNEALASQLEQNLTSKAGIRTLQINTRSSRILINYSPQTLSLESLFKLISRTTAEYKAAGRTVPAVKVPVSTNAHQVFELESLPIVRQLLWTVAAGALFLYVNFKHRSQVKAKGSSTIISLDNALTVLSGYPILKTASDHLLRKGHLSTEFLASTASFASIAVEEQRLGSFINLIVYLSTLLRTLAAEYTRSKIKAVLTGRQTKARLTTPDGTLMIGSHQLIPGDQVIIKRGERVPADGQVINGDAIICAHLPRGRTSPEKVGITHKVYAGSSVQQGEITVRAEQVGEETYIGRVLEMLQNGSCKPHLSHKRIMQLMHQVSVASLTIATGVYLVTGNARRAITMLIAGAPGAAGLGFSMALGAAAGQAAYQGILVKEDRYIETVGKADTFLFTDLPKKDQSNWPDITENLHQAHVSHVGLLTDKSPKQKADVIRRLQCEGEKVAVIGDINEDALALAAADVSITDTAGDDLTLQEAHILMVGPDYLKLPWLKHLSSESIDIARQNTLLSLGLNIFGLALGVFDYLTPLAMAILHNTSTFGILFNSSRLLLPASTNFVSEPATLSDSPLPLPNSEPLS